MMLNRVLATHRIVRLVTEDEIFDDLRVEIFRRWPPEEHKLSYLLSCKACMSMWAGLAVSSGLIPRFVVDALAASEAAVLIAKGLRRWDF